MPEVVYYKITRTQSITVASAFGETAAIKAGVAAMDEDMNTLNDLSASVPERSGPIATVRGRHQTDSILVERKSLGA